MGIDFETDESNLVKREILISCETKILWSFQFDFIVLNLNISKRSNMMKHKKLVLLFFSLLALPFLMSLAPKGDNPDAVLGVWLTGSGKARIKIYKSDDGKYQGKIVWLRDPTYPDGKKKVDKQNPDEGKRTTPIMGLQNLRNFVYDGENLWKDGQIYDPDNGNDYSCKMELKDENTLEVRGFIGISLFGRTDVWKRQVAQKK